MIFDLRGKRRRTVQATYLALAVLMGAGLVFFGIGSSVSGGLSDLFGGGGGDANSATKSVQKKIDAAEKTLQTSPNDPDALAVLVRENYNLATTTADPKTSKPTASGFGHLQDSADAWQRYLHAVDKPDHGVARYALQAYTTLAQSKSDPQDQKPFWEGTASAAEILTQGSKSPGPYVQLVQYATLAGQTRKADLAAKKALALAPKSQKKAVKQAITQAKGAAQQQGAAATPSG
jgi:hypothetical protein